MNISSQGVVSSAIRALKTADERRVSDVVVSSYSNSQQLSRRTKSIGIDDVKHLALKHIENWASISEDSLEVYRIPGGLTNTLYRVRLVKMDTSLIRGVKHATVLVRVYGETEGLLDRTKDESIAGHMGKLELSAKPLAMFDGGRIEQWIDGVALTVQEYRGRSVTIQVAIKLGVIHRQLLSFLEYSGPKSSWPTRPWVLRQIEHFYNLAMINMNKPGMEKNMSIAKLHEWHDECLYFEAMIRRGIKNTAKKRGQISLAAEQGIDCALATVFSHNDSQENNILRLNKSRELKLIDYEYADINFAGYDLANTFVEHTIDNLVLEEPYYRIEAEKYPDFELRKEAVRVYLDTRFSDDSSPEVAHYKDDAFVMGFLTVTDHLTLSSHLVWALWSFVKTEVSVDESAFDYFGYGLERLNGYVSLKNQLAAACLE